MRTFESEPMHSADAAVLHPRDGQEAVAEVRLGRRADADARSCRREQVELAAVGVGRVDDGRARAEAALAIEQLDRPEAVLGEAFVDLPRLFVGMDVERQLVRRGVAAELGQRSPPGRRARSGGRHRRGFPPRAASRARAGRQRPTPGGTAADPPRR